MIELTKEQQQVLNKYKDSKEISRTNTEELIWRWTEIVSALNRKLPDRYNERQDWQSKRYLPVFTTLFNAIVGQMDKIMYPTKESFFDIIPNDTGDTDAERIAANYKRLYVAIISKGGFWKKKKSLLKECAMIGCSLLKLSWNKRNSTIDYHWISATNVYLDDSVVDDFKESSFFGETYEQSIVDMLDDDRYTEEGKKALWEATSNNEMKANTTDQVDENREYLREVEFDGMQKRVNPIAKYKVDEFRIKYFDKEKDKHIWKIINYIPSKNVVLRIEDYEDGLNDIVYFPFNKMMYHLYGNGVMEGALDLQDALNDMFNLGIDNGKVSTFPMFIVEESVTNAIEDLMVEPLKAIVTPDGTKDRMGLQPLAPANYTVLIGFLNWIKEMMEETVGLTREAVGGTIRSSERTEGQAQLRLNASAERVVSFLKEYEIDGNIDMLYAMHYMINKYMKQSDIDKYLSYDIRERDFIDIDAESPLNATMIATGTETEEVPALDKQEDLKDFRFNFRMGGIFSLADRIEKEEKLRGTLEEGTAYDPEQKVINREEALRTLSNIKQLPNSDRIIIAKETGVENIQQEDLLNIPQEGLLEEQGFGVPSGGGFQDQLAGISGEDLEQSILEGEENV